MFDFEGLTVYQKAKEARKELLRLVIGKHNVDKSLLDQLKRAVLSIILNIAEGTGKSSIHEKRNFFTIARGSTYETAATIDLLKDDGIISDDDHKKLYLAFEEVSKMLMGLIKAVK